MQKLPPRHNAIAMPFVLSMLMTIVVSGISTLTVVGLKAGWHGLWYKAWLLSWAVAFPTMLFVLPIARRLVAQFVEQPGVLGVVGPAGGARGAVAANAVHQSSRE
jgi:Protein of unknown function (DUF2798)